MIKGNDLLQRDGLQFMRHGHGIVGFITNPARSRFVVCFHDEIQLVMLRRPIAKLEHFRKFVRRIDMQHRKRNAAKKCLHRQPNKDIGVLPHRPRHRDIFKRVKRLAKNEHALVLEMVEV